MSTLERQAEEGEKHLQTSSDTYSDEFNLDKGVDRTYEYKCNLSTPLLFSLIFLRTSAYLGTLVNRCLQDEYVFIRPNALMNILPTSSLSQHRFRPLPMAAFHTDGHRMDGR